jgi:diacylglycerol kinase (ATP)
MNNKHLGESFARAFDGLSHVMWTQRTVRVQLIIVLIVSLLAYFAQVTVTEFLFLLSAIALVVMAEVFNTALEVLVNMVTETYHPLARVAKDVAAAGVLIASIYGLAVGGFIFLPKLALIKSLTTTFTWKSDGDENFALMLVLGIFLLFIIVPLAKVRVGHGHLLRGGAVSGHAAVAFLLCAGIVIASDFHPLLTILALVLAVLVAQSRVEGKIHSLAEVIWGAGVALVLAALLWGATKFLW